jgi:type III restriction enzyme
MFNLAPCRGGLEAALVPFLDLKDNGIVAFAKNAGPQALRIDYVRANVQLSTYTPDFFVRTQDGQYWLVETKGREDVDVSRKAKAAISWCEAATRAGAKWNYTYVPQNATTAMGGGSFVDLVRACSPALDALIHEKELQEALPLFADSVTADVKAPLPAFIDEATIGALPDAARKAAEESLLMFEFLSKREGVNLAPVFTSMLGPLDSAARAMVGQRMGPLMPALPAEQRAWLEPYIEGAPAGAIDRYRRVAQNLRKTLLYGSGLMPMGLLRDCLDYALNDNARLGGVFDSMRQAFRFAGSRKILEEVTAVYDFRNAHVAHQDREITDVKRAGAALGQWIRTLAKLSTAGTAAA